MNPKIEIKYLEGDPNNVDYDATFENMNSNNITDISEIGVQQVGHVKGAKPFLFGCSTFGGGDILTKEKYCGYISQKLDGDGVWKMTLKAKEGKTIDSFILLFDDVAKQWPTKIYIDETDIDWNDKTKLIDKTFVNKGPRFIWKGEPKSEIYIAIIEDEWNVPDYPVRLTGIVVDGVNVYDKSDIQTINRSCILMDNNKKPFYGVTSGFAEVKLYDDEKFIAAVSDAGALSWLSPCKLSFDKEEEAEGNAEGNAEDNSIITALDIDSWEYTYSNNFVKVGMIDAVEKLRTKSFVGVAWQKTNKTASDLLGEIIESTKVNINVNNELNTLLNTYVLKYYHFSGGTAYDALVEFCTLTQTIIYTDRIGALNLVAIS